MSNNNGFKVVLLALLCILAAPIIIPIGLTVGIVVLSIAFSILVTLAALVIGFGSAAVGCLAAGIVAVIFGFFYLFHAPLAGFVVLGAGLLVLAIGLLFLILTILICGKLLPAVFRGIVQLCGMPFRRKEIIV